MRVDITKQNYEYITKFFNKTPDKFIAHIVSFLKTGFNVSIHFSKLSDEVIDMILETHKVPDDLRDYVKAKFMEEEAQKYVEKLRESYEDYIKNEQISEMLRVILRSFVFHLRDVSLFMKSEKGIALNNQLQQLSPGFDLKNFLNTYNEMEFMPENQRKVVDVLVRLNKKHKR